MRSQSIHDKDNCYPWFGTCSGNGTTHCGTDADCAVAGGTCDAGDCQMASPGGLTALLASDARTVDFFSGEVGAPFKGANFSVRAVRGGL